MNKSLPNQAVQWQQQRLRLLDQRCLPERIEFIDIHTAQAAHSAIQDMVVRGAPAIGICAAYAVVLSARVHIEQTNGQAWAQVCAAIHQDIQLLATARPTAVNLHWALTRMQACLHQQTELHSAGAALEREAVAIHEQDIAANETMGRLGAAYIEHNSRVMTHCNAGALATGGIGTALGVIRQAHADNKIDYVLASETRPWLQGARLTAWELAQEQIAVQLVCDSAAAAAMQSHAVDWVIVGADRVAANGDVANKIGTLSLAIIARHCGKKFMVVAPLSSIDQNTPEGAHIVIEQRHSREITHLGERQLSAPDVSAWNPVFDVTPAALIDVLVTEKGVIEQPDQTKIAALLAL